MQSWTEVFVWSSAEVPVWIPHSEGNTGQLKTQVVCLCVCVCVCVCVCACISVRKLISAVSTLPWNNSPQEQDQSKAPWGRRVQQWVLSKAPWGRRVQQWVLSKAPWGRRVQQWDKCWKREAIIEFVNGIWTVIDTHKLTMNILHVH